MNKARGEGRKAPGWNLTSGQVFAACAVKPARRSGSTGGAKR